MNALKMELAESKRQLELKTKGSNRFEQELSTKRQAAGLPLTRKQETQSGAALQGKRNLFVCGKRSCAYTVLYT